MKYRLLGNSGPRVSELALGTMTFVEDWGWDAPKEEAQKVYNAFRDAGGIFTRELTRGFRSGGMADRIVA